LPEEFELELPVVLPDESRYVVLPEELVVALPVVRPEASRYVVLDWAEAMLTDDTAKVIAAHTVKTAFIFHSPLFCSHQSSFGIEDTFLTVTGNKT
jgi:hypothetical protein